MSAFHIKAALLPDGTRTDLFVENGVFVESASNATVVDADGLQALPGLVDLHTHLREPGFEQSETVLTGSRAAASGGFTAVFAMANTSPVSDTGLVLAIAKTAVKPPLAEARLPVSTVSLCSKPGSRRWVCRSTRPGSACRPSASTVVALLADSTNTPFSTKKSERVPSGSVAPLTWNEVTLHLRREVGRAQPSLSTPHWQPVR